MNYSFGDCELDTGLYTLTRAGKIIRLRPKVFRVCLYLLEHRDRVVSRDELCTQVWSGQFISQTTLEGVIRAVRQAVGDSGQTQSTIQTLHGYGYRFIADVVIRPTATVQGDEVPAGGRSMGVTEDASMAMAEEAELMTATSAVEPTAHAVEPARSMVRPTLDDDYPVANPIELIPEEEQLLRQRAQHDIPWAGIALGLAAVMLCLVAWVSWGWVRGSEVALWEKSRIAVLPFLNLTSEPNHAHFGDAMTEVLITQLSQVPGLIVIARTSVMKYKDSRKDVATIGRELKVGTVLEGSVRTLHNHIRVNAQLIDVASQVPLWSQEFDRELTEVFTVQSDIASRVAEQLSIRLIARGAGGIDGLYVAPVDTLTLSLNAD